MVRMTATVGTRQLRIKKIALVCGEFRNGETSARSGLCVISSNQTRLRPRCCHDAIGFVGVSVVPAENAQILRRRASASRRPALPQDDSAGGMSWFVLWDVDDLVSHYGAGDCGHSRGRYLRMGRVLR
jgi:hypothetical protein